MLMIITASLVALALTYLIVTRTRKVDSNQLNQTRYSPITVGVQIICGDCSGDSIIPVKTYLDRSGNCSQCGGHSFLLASTLAVYAEHLRLARIAEYAGETNSGRVIPFESPTRAARSEKIAV
jgi:hypothetical protein